jgi:hypothetical protein
MPATGTHEPGCLIGWMASWRSDEGGVALMAFCSSDSRTWYCEEEPHREDSRLYLQDTASLRHTYCGKRMVMGGRMHGA